MSPSKKGNLKTGYKDKKIKIKKNKNKISSMNFTTNRQCIYNMPTLPCID
jgi:hypothetical protein